jgi:hypothetical protein
MSASNHHPSLQEGNKSFQRELRTRGRQWRVELHAITNNQRFLPY